MVNKKILNMHAMFSPKSVAVIGASRDPSKVGHIILRNYIDAGYPGRLYPINKNADTIIGLKAYASVLSVKDRIDLAVIAIPAEFVPAVLEECGRAGVKSVVVVSGGFSEVGSTGLQESITSISAKYNMAMIGPNCLGIMDPRSRVDTLFLPAYKFSKPSTGGVSFVSQSGAVGSTILDVIAKEGIGLSKFISYGNAAYIDEADILEYLLADEDTKVIVMYIEGVKDGRHFVEVVKKATMKKPIVVIKGGISEAGSAAAHSHTAALAGNYQAYEAVFRQFGMSVAKDLAELLYFAKAFATEPLPRGNRVAIITNGGGTGVLTADEVSIHGLELSKFASGTEKSLRGKMPSIVNIRNPLDMAGDADNRRYGDALEAISQDPNVDMIIVIALFQTPGADSTVAAKLLEYKEKLDKPLVVISAGSDYTEIHKQMMEHSGLPVYDSPAAAASALAELLRYYKYLNKIV